MELDFIWLVVSLGCKSHTLSWLVWSHLAICCCPEIGVRVWRPDCGEQLKKGVVVWGESELLKP